MSLSKDTLAKLARFDTPTICNVIELFDIRPRNRGYMDARVRSNGYTNTRVGSAGFGA